MAPTQYVFIAWRGPFEFTDADFVADAGPQPVSHDGAGSRVTPLSPSVNRGRSSVAGDLAFLRTTVTQEGQAARRAICGGETAWRT